MGPRAIMNQSEMDSTNSKPPRTLPTDLKPPIPVTTTAKPPKALKISQTHKTKDVAESISNLSVDYKEENSVTIHSRTSRVWNEPVYVKNERDPPYTGFDYVPPPVLQNSKTPLNVVVERGTRFFGDPLRTYPMYSKPRGYALILNNQEFDNPSMYPYRQGAQVDSDNLEKLFTQLGFKVIRYKNLNRKETVRALEDFADVEENKMIDMMILCILSHGKENGKIVTTDGIMIDTEVDVLRKFNNDWCPQLKGKPKFFIIQACRGDETDYGYLAASKESCTDTDATPHRGRKTSLPLQTYKELSWEDMLIAYSTLPGYVSNRDHYRGTWFIESICKVFMEQAKDTNLRDMLDEVGLVLSRYESEMGTKQSFNYDVRHFYKKLYFNPGIEIGPKEKWRYSTSIDYEDTQIRKSEETKKEEVRQKVTVKRKMSINGIPQEMNT